jgi:hypothetical protein
MFIQTWNKYLPVIKILLKRSVNAAQTLDMNKSDFQRAAGGKKVKFTFSIVLIKGRIRGLDNPPPLAKDLVTALQQDDTTNSFIRENELEISMNSDFQLLIKNTTPEADPEPKIEETALATEEVKPNDVPARPD